MAQVSMEMLAGALTCADGSDEGAQCCDGTYSAYTEDICAADCNGDIFGDAVVDCAGDCTGGSAVVDECGECNGDGSSCNTTCTDYSLSEGGGSYDSEISWDIDGGLGGDGAAGDFTVCLADQIFTIHGVMDGTVLRLLSQMQMVTLLLKVQFQVMVNHFHLYRTTFCLVDGEYEFL